MYGVFLHIMTQTTNNPQVIKYLGQVNNQYYVMALSPLLRPFQQEN